MGLKMIDFEGVGTFSNLKGNGGLAAGHTVDLEPKGQRSLALPSFHWFASSRRTPQTAHDQDDAFVAGVIDSSEWARKHQQLLTLIVIAVGLLIAGGFYYVNFRRTMRIEAVNQLERIHQTIAIGASGDARAQLSTYLDQFASPPASIRAAPRTRPTT